MSDGDGSGGGWQPVRHVGPTVRVGELLAVTGTLVLLVATFALRWYGAAGTGGLERPGPPRTLGAWEALTVTRWFVVATLAGSLAAIAVRALRRGRPLPTGPAATLAAVAAATALVLAIRVLISPPQPDRVFDIKLGAELGLLGAAMIAAGATESWRSGRSGAERGVPRGLQAAARGSTLTPAR